MREPAAVHQARLQHSTLLIAVNHIPVEMTNSRAAAL